MFEGIPKRSGRCSSKSLRGRGRITEENVREGLKLVRTSLLEADVNYDVANQLSSRRCTAKAIGQEVLKTLDPSEQIVEILYQELTSPSWGPSIIAFTSPRDRPAVLMMCGLQGSGKTTTVGKLALMLREKHGKRPMLVAADLQRPAAVHRGFEGARRTDRRSRLRRRGGDRRTARAEDPVTVCFNALAAARKQNCDVVILDTAGRLHVAEMPMEELKQIDRQCKPD